MTYEELILRLTEKGYSVEINDMGIPVILTTKENNTDRFKNKIHKLVQNEFGYNASYGIIFRKSSKQS